MTKKTIKASDVLGDNYYVYELSSSNYTPALNDTITITCTMKDVYGTTAGSKSITLYQNGTNKGTQTTNSSGVATWSITCSTAGLQKFNIKDTSIEVFVDNKAVSSHQHGNITSNGKLTTSHNGTYSTFIGVQDSTGTLYKASKINSNIIIDGTAHDNIGSNANDNQSAINTAINTALGNKANSTHNHTVSNITDFPTIPSKPSDLTNDNGFLTSHQDISGKEDKTNKVTSISSSSTDTEYPSAKAVYSYAEPKIEDTGWQNISFSSGYQNYSSSTPVRYRRIGKIVHLEGKFKNNSATTPGQNGVVFGNITDSTCFPTYEQHSLQQGSGADKFLLGITPDGQLYWGRYGTTSVSTQAGASTWLHCYATWFVD